MESEIMPRKPKCKICGLDVDKEGDNWFKNSVGYYHITCRQKKNLPITEDEHLANKSIAPESVKEEFLKRDSGAKTIKCYFCGLAADSVRALRKDGKAFHNDCYPEYKDRTELFRYCCKLWGLKAPGPLIARQAKQFKEKGYTYKGMLFSLKYFYEVKHNDKNKYKGSETIGIIPFVYEDAKAYYEDLILQKQVLAQQAEKVTAKEVKVVKIKPIKQKPELFEFE